MKYIIDLSEHWYNASYVEWNAGTGREDYIEEVYITYDHAIGAYIIGWWDHEDDTVVCKYIHENWLIDFCLESATPCDDWMKVDFSDKEAMSISDRINDIYCRNKDLMDKLSDC